MLGWFKRKEESKTVAERIAELDRMAPPLPPDPRNLPEPRVHFRTLESWRMYSPIDAEAKRALKELFPDPEMWAYGQLIIDLDSVATVERLLDQHDLPTERQWWDRHVHPLAQFGAPDDPKADLKRFLRRGDGPAAG
jgi:hypothetical protein